MENFNLSTLLLFIGQAGYFYFPAYVANMTPVLVKWIPWETSISTKYLGANKTWRGLTFGCLSAVLTAIGLHHFVTSTGLNYFERFDLSIVQIALVGFLLGFGALLGDAVESYFKRKRGIASGEQWKIADQVDFTLGATLFVIPWVWDKLLFALMGMALGSCIQPLVSKFAYAVGWKKRKKTQDKLKMV